MQEIVDKWDELKKALNHAQSVRSAKVTPPKADQPVEAHPDTLEQVKYGTRNIPGAKSHHEMKSTPQSKMGFAKIGGKGYVVRHGHAAQRTDVEHQMSKLLGADHMLPDQSYDHGINHPHHHGEETFDPHDHGGMSIQEHHDGEHVEDALDDDKLSGKLKEQWKNGDLHKLWALHYISNNADMHSDNFNVGKEGVKSYDSDNAFYEVPTGHVVHRAEGEDGQHGDPEIKYMPYGQSQLPAYLHPFVETDNDEGIEAKHKDQQISVKSLNEHASKIQPDLFENFGPHAAERAAKAKKALMSSDPTGEMQKLWNDHSDKTGDLTWDKNQSRKKQAA